MKFKFNKELKLLKKSQSELKPEVKNLRDQMKSSPHPYHQGELSSTTLAS